MKRVFPLAILALTGASCVSAPRAPHRAKLIRGILTSTVQVRSEREGGARRAASGVVVATDPGSRRTWIATARHFVDPSLPQDIYVRLPGRTGVVPATVAFVSPDHDLAFIETAQLDVEPVRLKMAASLGDEVLLVAFPWGRRFTVVRGIVSQIVPLDGILRIEGPARMIDASATHGSSGGGVFDAYSGELIGIVESYRTAKIDVPGRTERPLEIPVAGETTIIHAPAIMALLSASGLEPFLPK